METTNRLTNYFHALGWTLPTKPAQPQPMTGEPHYRIATYTPAEVDAAWAPASLEDSIVELDYSQIRYRDRYRELLPALFEARRINELSMAGGQLSQWATLCYLDQGNPNIVKHFARVVLPLRYYVHSVLAPRTWKLGSLLAAPPWNWLDETCLKWRKGFDCLDCAVVEVAKHNRKRKRHWWHVVLAVEADEANGRVVLDFQGVRGSATLYELGRAHVVTTAWPLSAEARQLIGGAV